MIRWKMLEGIGAYVAGELSGEEARKVERLLREDPEALGLAESYTQLLALLSAVGRESPVPPPSSSITPCGGRPTIFEPANYTKPTPVKDAEKAGQEDTGKEGQKSDV